MYVTVGPKHADRHQSKESFGLFSIDFQGLSLTP